MIAINTGKVQKTTQSMWSKYSKFEFLPPK